MSNNVLPNLSEWFEVPVEVESTYFTGQPIEAPKKTLEDVIRDAGSSVSDIAKAVEAFYAEQKSKQPRVIIDFDGDEWRRNDDGRYDLNGDRSISFVGYTREHIEHVHGIKEERD